MRWLSARLEPGMQVFEWGSGSSTLYFARRVSRVVTIEHDRVWHDRLLDELRRRGTDNVRAVFLPPREPAAQPGRRRLAPAAAFSDYVQAISDYEDESFDLVLIDGRARCECLRVALQKVKTNGFILLDDSERPAYASAFELAPTPAWSILHLSGPTPGSLWPAFKRTTVFCRRASPAARRPPEAAVEPSRSG